MTDIEQLAVSLEAWAPLISSGYEVPAAAQPMLDAAKKLIAQSERLARYETALRNALNAPMIDHSNNNLSVYGIIRQALGEDQ